MTEKTQGTDEIERDMEKEVATHLRRILAKLCIDRPSNFDDIVEFMVEDVEASADEKGYHSGDFDIAFRRYLEKDSQA